MKAGAVWLLAAVPLLSGAADAPWSRGLESIRETDLRADLAFLTSDALEGRLSLHRGSEVAIGFVAAEFAKAGLVPLAGGSFLQTVPLIEYRVDPEGTRLSLTRHGITRTFRYLEEFSGGEPDEANVEAPVVFAGYGITAPEFGYDDYAGIDVRGKIVLVFEHEPQENDPKSIFNGLGNTRYASAGVKARNAKRHGAVGLLLAAEPNRKHPSGADRLKRSPGGAERLRRLLPQALGDTTGQIPALTVTDEVAAELFSTVGKKPAELQAAIDKALRPASAPLPDTRVSMRIALAERRRGNSANAIGILEGRDPTLRDEAILFSGHYDHDGMWDGHLRPGADDNGSGSVGVLALARAYARNPLRPKRSLIFAEFAAEERGLLGAYYYAAHPLRPLERLRAVLNFDMIGRNETPSRQTEGLIDIAPDTSNELNLIGTINCPDVRRTVEEQNREIGLKLNYKWDQDAALNIFQRSDQFPFALRNIPAVWWFTGFHPDYHQTTDTVEKINFSKMERILKLAYLSGWALAEQDRPPKFIDRPGSSE